jgi:hypothetical protein
MPRRRLRNAWPTKGIALADKKPSLTGTERKPLSDEEIAAGAQLYGTALNISPGFTAAATLGYGLYSLFKDGSQDLSEDEIQKAIREGNLKKALELRAKKSVTAPEPTMLPPAPRAKGKRLDIKPLPEGTEAAPLFGFVPETRVTEEPYSKRLTIVHKDTGEVYEVDAADLYGKDIQTAISRGVRVPAVAKDAPFQFLFSDDGGLERMIETQPTDIQPGNLLYGTGGDLYNTLDVNWGAREDEKVPFIDFIKKRVAHPFNILWALNGKSRFATNRELVNFLEGINPTYTEIKPTAVRLKKEKLRRKKGERARSLPENLAVSPFRDMKSLERLRAKVELDLVGERAGIEIGERARRIAIAERYGVKPPEGEFPLTPGEPLTGTREMTKEERTLLDDRFDPLMHAPFYAKRAETERDMTRLRNEKFAELEGLYAQIQDGTLSLIPDSKKLENDIKSLSRHPRFHLVVFTDSEARKAEEFARTSPDKRGAWLKKNKSYLDRVQPWGVIPRQGETVDTALASGRWARIRIAVEMLTHEQWSGHAGRAIEELRGRYSAPLHANMIPREGMLETEISPTDDISPEDAAERQKNNHTMPIDEVEDFLAAYRARLKESDTPEMRKSVAIQRYYAKVSMTGQQLAADRAPTKKDLKVFAPEAGRIIRWEALQSLSGSEALWKKTQLSRLKPGSVRFSAAERRLRMNIAGIQTESLKSGWNWIVGELPQKSTWVDIPWTEGRYAFGNPLDAEDTVVHGVNKMLTDVVKAVQRSKRIYHGWDSMDNYTAPTMTKIPYKLILADHMDARSKAVVSWLRGDDPESSWSGLYGLRWNPKARWMPEALGGKGAWQGGWLRARNPIGSSNPYLQTALGVMSLGAIPLLRHLTSGPESWKDIPELGSKYEAMPGIEVAMHVGANMPEELAGLIMFFPHIGELVVDAIMEPFSGRTAVESFERLSENTSNFSNAISESLALHYGDPTAGRVEEGAITQFLWYLPMGQVAAVPLRSMARTTLVRSVAKRLTGGRATMIETGKLVLEEGRLRAPVKGEKTLFELAKEELAKRKAEHKKEAKATFRAWMRIRNFARGKEIITPEGVKMKEVIIPKGKKRQQKKHEKQKSEYEKRKGKETQLQDMVTLAEAMIRQYETKVPNPQIAALPRNVVIFLEKLPDIIKRAGSAGLLTGTLSPIGSLETLGTIINWAIKAEGRGVLRWYLNKPSELLTPQVQLFIQESASAQRRGEMLNRFISEQVPKEHRKTLQDIMQGAEDTLVKRRDLVNKKGKAHTRLEEIRIAQMKRVLRPNEDIKKVTMDQLKTQERIWIAYEESIPGVIWKSDAGVTVIKEGVGKQHKVGGWVVNPILEGEVSATLLQKFKGQAEFANKWGRDLSLRAVELSSKIKNIRFWNPLTNKWQIGMLDSQTAINKFWWPQQYREWGEWTHALNEAVPRLTNFLREKLGMERSKDIRAQPLWKKTQEQMIKDLDVLVADPGAPQLGAATSKLRISKLNEKGYPLEAKRAIGLEQDLVAQTIGGLGDAEFAYRQYKVYQVIARDPNLTFQGPRVAKSPYFMHKPGTPPQKQIKVEPGIYRRGGWIQMSEAEMIAGGGTPRWGELAGRWIKEDIFWHLKYAEEIAQAASKNVWASRTVLWKQWHTVWNAPTLLRNFYTNVLLFAPMNDMMMIGRNVEFYQLALKEMSTGGRLFKEAWRRGAFDGTFARTELGRSATTAVLRGVFGRGTMSGEQLMKVGEALMKRDVAKLSDAARFFLSETPGALYSAMDDFFRFAHWLKLTDKGKAMGPLLDQMAKYVRGAWIDYENIPGLVQVLRAPTQMGLGARNIAFFLAGKPFFSFTWMSLDKAGPIRTWLKNNPVKAQIWMNLHETLSVQNFAEAMGSDVEAAKRWMKVIKHQQPPWRRFRYIPASSTGIIGKIIEAVSGEKNISVVKRYIRNMKLDVPADQWDALPEGSSILGADNVRVAVTSLDDAVDKAGRSLGDMGDLIDRRMEVSEIIRRDLGIPVRYDKRTNMWVAQKKITRTDIVPLVSRWFNIGYYTPIDWLIPQLEAYDGSNPMWEFLKQVWTNQNPITGLAVAMLTGVDPHFKDELYRKEADKTYAEDFVVHVGAWVKYAYQNIFPPWIPGGNSWEKIMDIGREDRRGRVRDMMEVWLDVFLGIKYESDVRVPDNVARQFRRFSENVGEIKSETEGQVITYFDTKFKGFPQKFDYVMMKRISRGKIEHPVVSRDMATDAIAYYERHMVFEGIKALRRLRKAIMRLPAMPPEYEEWLQLGEEPVGGVFDETLGPFMMKHINVVAVRAVIDELPLDLWERMAYREWEPPVDEENFFDVGVAFFKRQGAKVSDLVNEHVIDPLSEISGGTSEAAETARAEEMIAYMQKLGAHSGMTREQLIELSKEYIGTQKGYRLVYKQIFGEYDPEALLKTKGLIPILRTLSERVKKVVEHKKLQRMYIKEKQEKKDNGND